MEFAEVLALPSFQRALVLLIATGVGFPLIGVALLKLDLVPARIAVLHTAVLGATVVGGLGGPPLVGALLASVGTGLVVARLSLSGRGSPSGVLAAIMSVSLALAFAAASWFDFTALQALSLLWGDILAATRLDTVAVVVMSITLVVCTIVFFKDLQLVLFSPALARDLGFPVGRVFGWLIVAVCLVIALAMRLTGALLVDGLTILPALAAIFVARSFRATLLLAVAIGLAANVSGFVLAIIIDLPVSAAIILCGFAAVLIAAAFQRRA